MNQRGRPTRQTTIAAITATYSAIHHRRADAVGAEVGAHGELMSEHEGDSEIRVQVHGVPRLPCHPSPSGSDGRDADSEEQCEAHDRHEYVGVVLHEVDDLGDDRLAASHRVPDV